MTASPTRPVASWILHSLAGDTAPPPAPETETPAWWKLADEQGALTLLCARLAESGVIQALPLPLQERIKRQQRSAIATDMLHEAELSEVLQALAAHHLSPLLLKGADLAHSLYPAPHLRPRCDSDLLFAARADAERAWGVLQGLGFRRPLSVASEHFSHQFSCHRNTSGGGFTLDIHWRISNKPLFAQALGFAELAPEARPIPALGPHARGLAPVHALLFAAMHRIGHAAEGSANRWIWLYDIHLLAAGLDAPGWTRLAQLAKRKGLSGILLDGLQAAADHFETAIPLAIRQQLERQARGERFGAADFASPLRVQWADFRALPGLHARWGFIREHLRPDPAYMRKKYPQSQAPLAWLYLRRAFGGVLKTLRRP